MRWYLATDCKFAQYRSGQAQPHFGPLLRAACVIVLCKPLCAASGQTAPIFGQCSARHRHRLALSDCPPPDGTLR